MNKINKKGMAIEILVFLIMLVLMSALILFLVKFGIVSVKQNNQQLLDTEFLPLGRPGALIIKNIQFCSFVDAKLQCLESKENFRIGEKIYFQIAAESSTSDGAIKIVENYRIHGPDGTLFLDAESSSNYHLEIASPEQVVPILLSDFFIVNPGAPQGKYTISVIIENPLLNKKTTVSKAFMVES